MLSHESTSLGVRQQPESGLINTFILILLQVTFTIKCYIKRLKTLCTFNVSSLKRRYTELNLPLTQQANLPYVKNIGISYYESGHFSLV
jgi:hypothetical protein